MPRPVMLFAAGFGTRMGALTKERPKPLVQVNGRALIDYALELTSSPAVSTVIVNTHYFADQMEKHLKEIAKVKTIFEPTILETGGGLKNALPLIGTDPTFTLNSDAVWNGENPLEILEAHWDEKLMDGLLLLLPKEKARLHKGNGDFFLENGLLERRGEAETAPFVYSGAQILKTSGLAKVQETAFSLNVLWDQMMQQKRLYGVVYSGDWVDVGSPEGLFEAEEMLKNAH